MSSLFLKQSDNNVMPYFINGRAMPSWQVVKIYLWGLILISCFTLLMPCNTQAAVAADQAEIMRILSEHLESEQYAQKAVIVPLNGGFSGDRLYKVVSQNDTFAFRFHEDTKSLLSKEQVYQCTDIAHTLGIGPKVRYVSKDFGILVVDFVNGVHPDTNTFKDDAMIQLLATHLRKLHHGPAFSQSWSVFNDIKNWLPAHPKPSLQTARATLARIEAALARASYPKQPCHNDIQPGNILLEGQRMKLIDWGDGGMGDPYYDLARASLLFAFNEQQETLFLSTYMDVVTPLAKARLFVMKQVFLIRFSLWAHAQTNEIDENILCIIMAFFNAQGIDVIAERQDIVLDWQAVSEYALKIFLSNTQHPRFEQSLQQIKSMVAQP